VYKGKDEILLSKLILEPAHSILTQSYDCRLRMVGLPLVLVLIIFDRLFSTLRLVYLQFGDQSRINMSAMFLI